MNEQNNANSPAEQAGDDVARASHAAPADGGGGDWRAAWRAARFSDDDGQGEPGQTRAAEAARHGAATGWLPSDDPVLPARIPAGAPNGRTWETGPQTAVAASSVASSRSVTSTLDPSSRPDGAVPDETPVGDAPASANGTGAPRPGFRALLTQGLAQARARLDGRVDVDPSAPPAPAAGSISAPVAASLAAVAIPTIAPRPAPTPVPAPVAVAPPAAMPGTAPSVSLPAAERAATPAVVIPSGVPAVVPAVVPISMPLPAAVPVAAPIAAVGAVGIALANGPAPTPTVSGIRKPAASARRPGRLRRAHLKVTRIDPWTVMKISFMLAIAFGIMTIVAVAVVWSMLDAAGVFTSINDTLSNVTGGTDSSSGFDLLKWVALDRVLGITTLIAVVDVVLITALSTLGAFLYNLASALLGGVEVTLVEDQR